MKRRPVGCWSFTVARVPCAVAIGASHYAIAQKQEALFQLGENDGVFVDKRSFDVVRANGAKGNPKATLERMGAREVSGAAAIYRHEGKLYIVDGTPPQDSPPQFMITLQEWCATCHWYTPGSYMNPTR